MHYWNSISLLLKLVFLLGHISGCNQVYFGNPCPALIFLLFCVCASLLAVVLCMALFFHCLRSSRNESHLGSPEWPCGMVFTRNQTLLL
ncbi:hypothetical protein BX661DRAFT_185070 [Kickxella alabastrina]|uniref:uncharacterized protein n=1 Tax=Kickxella alabastrina TaxID=61397 RepID=UPI00221E81D7|nr:uncharacterized protein BX661DRAFT_185070 [Kickxella alabastrina]KAI7824990.1 hypothetical protein BX661DRAFT_185070 [Kickxella alabastrina]